jgi:hypothetical protein
MQPSGTYILLVLYTLNAVSLIVGGVVDKQFIEATELYPQNAYFPIEVTLAGIVIVLRYLEPQNADSPILFTPSSRVISAVFVHS